MCILCVVQRWSRRVATMLPWLVIPFILLWALSQLFPPNLRFEITSPRLACVLVLLVTLFWYEILMPQLSVWRARRSARLREQRMIQAIELQKMKKSATRKCRNCNTPYRDQNPGGGKFMCNYCGHVSKRPVLDFTKWQDWYGGHGGDGRCLAEKSYSGVLTFGCEVVGSLFENARLVCGKVFRIGLRDDASGDGDGGGLSCKRGENGGSFQESRGEKARRKAEEKRQARLEREMLEEEERKQREEVARLVEERRRLRDEILEAEQERMKGMLGVDADRETRKETERRKRERRKEKGSNKSNSDDGEELEKRASRENEKKREFDKKGEIERQKALVENFKLQVLDGGNVNKVGASKTKYFDRMKGTFLSSSRGFNGASFFGRNAQAAPAVNKVSRAAVAFVDNGHNSLTRKDAHSVQNVIGKSSPNLDHNPVVPHLQPRTTVLKKSWHQLFTRSTAVSPEPDSNTLNLPSQNSHLDHARSVTDQVICPSNSYDKQYNFGRSLPLSGYSSPNGSLNGDMVSHVGEDSMFSPMKDAAHSSVVDEAELFEDPCYVPDPVGLLGPFSDSLDKFPLDLGTGFIESNKVEGPRIIKNVSAAFELTKPSPIERQVSCTPKSQKLHNSNLDESTDAHERGTWQMWGTPLARDGLNLVGGPSSWFSPLVQSKSQREDVIPSIGHNPVIPPIANVDNLQTHGSFSPLGPGMNGNDPWLQNSAFSPRLPVDGESHFLPLDLIKNITQNEDSTPSDSAAVHPFQVPQSNDWSKESWTLNGTHEAGNSATPVKPPNIGSLFSTGPDVQSVWSFNHQ